MNSSFLPDGRTYTIEESEVRKLLPDISGILLSMPACHAQPHRGNDKHEILGKRVEQSERKVVLVVFPVHRSFRMYSSMSFIQPCSFHVNPRPPRYTGLVTQPGSGLLSNGQDAGKY